jgi:ACS family hexuronate transporter-like MFS transporter
VAHAWGWRAAFLCTGGVGAAWLLLWQWVSRRDSLRIHQPRSAVQGGRRPSFRDARIWGFACAYAGGALPLALVLYGAAIFLSRRLGASQLTIGELLWIPPLGWEIGYFFWGWLADRGIPPSRLLACAAVLGLPLAAAPWTASITAAMALMFVAMFAAAGPIIISIGWAARVYSTAHSGFIAGLGAGAWSLSVAVVMPVFGRLFDKGRFDLGFALAAAFPFAGYAAFRIGLRVARDEG